MDYSWGWPAGERGFMIHEFEPFNSFVEIIFSLMRVFSKYLIRINPSL